MGIKTSLIRSARYLGRCPGARRVSRLVPTALRTALRNPAPSHEVFGYFTDSMGNRIPLLAGLRDELKPGWEWVLQPRPEYQSPSTEEIDAKLKQWRGRLESVEAYLGLFSGTLVGKEVLEVGAHDGATAYALAELGAAAVTATDMAAYYLTQSHSGQVSAPAVEAMNDELAQMRGSYRSGVADHLASRVEFAEDDLCTSSLPDESVDVIVSWEVLEHLTDPRAAFSQMERILRPGGFAFHEYNPFMSLFGGHSPCTLDFVWGHARLHAEDFSRYVHEIRPTEETQALSFYRNNLNRMTLADLRGDVAEAGLTTIDLLAWTSKSHMNRMSPEVLQQCRNIYPSAELTDLVSPTVWLVLRKPSSR